MSNPTEFPQSTQICVNNIELEVFEAGLHNKGNPIVLCHGWPEHAYSWRYQVPILVEAGYHVIIPNQRGFGGSSRPEQVTDYDIAHLTGDLVGLLDHYGYDQATFVGHDWGAMVVWGMALLHPDRVTRMINLSVPYQERWERPWIEMMEQLFGPDFYFVHFNRQPGVADAILDENTSRFLRNLYRQDLPAEPPAPGMMMINLAQAEEPLGAPIMSDADLDVFTQAFAETGFTPSINWYRNLDRNWHLLGAVEPILTHPTLMVYGTQDTVAQSETLQQFVPNVDIAHLQCGHWIQQEKPEELNELMLGWLGKNGAN